MRMVLEQAGFAVSTAGTGAEALRRADADHPDSVLLDMRLPDQPGQEVAAALRSRGARVPRIIIVTGMTLDDRDPAALGADVILRKPFGPDRLIEVLQEQL